MNQRDSPQASDNDADEDFHVPEALVFVRLGAMRKEPSIERFAKRLERKFHLLWEKIFDNEPGI